jgi:hypothetical protein
MVKLTTLKNGQVIGISIVEVISVPFFELLDKNIDRANYLNQVLFTQLITGFHRRAEINNTAIEFLFQSVGVDNQTYKAQVKLFVILRKIGENADAVENNIKHLMQSIKYDLEEKNFAVSVFDDLTDFQIFEHALSSVHTESVLAVSKNERVMTNSMSGNGIIYYTDIVDASENINLSTLTNAMTQYPGSLISIQVIPTQYTSAELQQIEKGKVFLNYYVSNLKYQQGLRVDNNVQAIVDAYDYYFDSIKEQLFYYNFVVYGTHNGAHDLANKLILTIEAEGKATFGTLETVDLSGQDLKPGKGLSFSPWTTSDLLIFHQREMSLWGTPYAPSDLIRLKFLMTTRELRSILKFPIDDGKSIGFESKKELSNREKLHKSIISEDNFKIGMIQNTSRNDINSIVHAGITLNDFTKHGLIVGMPGSGKTNFSLGLLLQFWNDFKIPFLVIEPTKNEYRSLIDAISDLQIFTPGKNNVSPYIINPFLPPRGVTIESYIPSLMTAFKAAFSMPNPLPDIFLSAINDCYNEYGWKSDSTVDDAGIQFFGLYEFIKVFKKKIQNLDYKGEVKSNLESAGVVRLISLIEQNSHIYDTINTIPLEDLLSKPTVIELNAINNKEQKSLIMALLLILICVYTKNNVAGDGKLKNVMLIDEAHVLLAAGNKKSEDSADSQGSTIEALEDMIAEIRSYGTSIIIADQSPTKVGRSIVANTNVKIIFKLVEKENKDAISTATNMSPTDYDLLGRLGVGEAMLHYGRVYTPLHIKTYNVLDRAVIRNVITDAEVTSLSRYWDNHQLLLIPHIECKNNVMCSRDCEFKVKVNADYLASKLINLYLFQIADKPEFIKFLVQMDKPLGKILEENPMIVSSLRLTNCAKIKFLRKAVLNKNFNISKNDYNVILNHPNFLKKM